MLLLFVIRIRELVVQNMSHDEPGSSSCNDELFWGKWGEKCYSCVKCLHMILQRERITFKTFIVIIHDISAPRVYISECHPSIHSYIQAYIRTLLKNVKEIHVSPT